MEATTKGGESKEQVKELSFSMYHWGPLLFKKKVKKEDLEALKIICKESTENWSENLAGIIDDEMKIDSGKYTKIITPYLKAYKQAYFNWYGLELKAVEITAAWVNYMKSGESNPPHIHHNCHLSSTLITEMPDEIRQEQKDWKGTGEGPAALSFFMGNPQNFHTNSFAFQAEPGDFFIFPWNLTHSVSTFKSNVVRSSVAANFMIKDNNIFEKKKENGKDKA